MTGHGPKFTVRFNLSDADNLTLNALAFLKDERRSQVVHRALAELLEDEGRAPGVQDVAKILRRSWSGLRLVDGARGG